MVKEEVVLRLSSFDCTWKSCRIYAKVTPSLFTNVILRLPALKHNLLVIGYIKRLVVFGRTDSDLMTFHYSDSPHLPVEHGP